jgi:hypothetical protein
MVIIETPFLPKYLAKNIPLKKLIKGAKITKENIKIIYCSIYLIIKIFYKNMVLKSCRNYLLSNKKKQFQNTQTLLRATGALTSRIGSFTNRP